MNYVTVSAPGKLMLFGEHAVVWGHPCIVTAVDKRITLTVEKTDDQSILIEAPDMQISCYKKTLPEFKNTSGPKEIEFIEEAVKVFFNKFAFSNGLKITTKSDFSCLYGFGSSSAVTACTLFALSKLFNKPLSEKQLFSLGYQVILKIQKVGSGFDLASAIYGGTLYYISGGKEITPLTVNALPMIVGYTGIKASTPILINHVGVLEKKRPELTTYIFKEITHIVSEAKIALEKANWKKTGELMNINHGLLDTLGVSCLMLSKLVYAARMEGAYGAKLSGAGGGDCMIALVSERTKSLVEKAIQEEGGVVVPVSTNAEGIRIEHN
jgi:mevalonate kinase